jgi:hypothetical protein
MTGRHGCRAGRSRRGEAGQPDALVETRYWGRLRTASLGHPVSASGHNRRCMKLSDLLQFDRGPRIAHIEDVPALDYRSFEGRVDTWQRAGVVPALTKISALFSKLDLAVISDRTASVTKDFIATVRSDVRDQLRVQIDRGNQVLHPTGASTARARRTCWSAAEQRYGKKASRGDR